MKFSTKTIALGAVLALSAVPAFALPAQVPGNQGTQHAQSHAGAPAAAAAAKPTTKPGPAASAKAKGKAYGKYCADQSRKHVAGQHGTPFSLCVTAMAKLASKRTSNPTTACKTESKKHVAGQHGTPFSKCVSAGAKLLEDQG